MTKPEAGEPGRHRPGRSAPEGGAGWKGGEDGGSGGPTAPITGEARSRCSVIQGPRVTALTGLGSQPPPCPGAPEEVPYSLPEGPQEPRPLGAEWPSPQAGQGAGCASRDPRKTHSCRLRKVSPVPTALSQAEEFGWGRVCAPLPQRHGEPAPLCSSRPLTLCRHCQPPGTRGPSHQLPAQLADLEAELIVFVSLCVCGCLCLMCVALGAGRNSDPEERCPGEKPHELRAQELGLWSGLGTDQLGTISFPNLTFFFYEM